jgi:hypothetical protein
MRASTTGGEELSARLPGNRTPEQHKASTRKAKASIKDHNRKFYGFDLSLSINGKIRKWRRIGKNLNT